ncbi:MAG: dTDP-4-dehydrorhamnose 3,5-epimerase family protein [Candidatus Levybacteria bacterium]|nr:dTDP-4-dehydrorhamnose 3,5-epimerase family protein [Candidatus Levybacteria bacterium]
MEFITLKNKNETKLIHDIIMHPLKVNKDASGILVETLRKDWKEIYGPGREFAMQYYSITPSKVARDEDLWHYHQMQEDRFLVVSGAIVVAVADNRQDSFTNGLLNLFYMEAHKDPYILLIPKKTLHGFMVVSQTSATLLNYPTALYNPKDELRIAYSEVNVKMSDGSLFFWESVRKNLINLPSL